MWRIFSILLIISTCIQADTIDHYMNIASNIPQMEMKADPQSQAWARSARNIIILASETVGESLLLANDTAKAQGNPLFCLPPGVQLNSGMMNDLIQRTYREISSQESDKNKMTISQVALIGLTKQYPCQQKNQQTNPLMPNNPIPTNNQLTPNNQMAHMGGLPMQ